MYQALYRKYRPKTFEEVVGQDVIVKTLINSIKNEKVSHAYLFSGPRGTGKTSIAKIFAKILNCEKPNGYEPCNKCISCEQANNNQNIDIIEIDAASNNGVDEIREIRNKISLVPSNSKYKIYIIDEVHMLTNQAFNALLKTLEEPPSHIIFIFATTEPQKIPKTILSRCQRFDYKKVSNKALFERLKFITKKEKIKISDEAIMEIAKLSDGGVRDSISLLDQALSYSDEKITLEDIHTINGTLTDEEVEQLVFNVLNNNLVEVIESIEKYDSEGKNIIKITQEIINKLKDILLYINNSNLINKTDFYSNFNITYNNKIINLLKKLSISINEMKNINDAKLLLEIEIIKSINEKQIISQGEIINNNIDNAIDNISIKTNVNNEVNKDVENDKNTMNVKAKTDIVNNEIKLDLSSEKFKEFKKRRIINSLSNFSKKEREKFKELLSKLKDYIDNPNYSKYISIINDGEFKSISNNNLLFIYKSSLMSNLFNLDIDKLEQMFYEIFNKKYLLISIDNAEWEIIKNDYNSNKSKYNYIEENISFTNLLINNKDTVNDKKKNSIDVMFDDIIEYE